MPAIIKVENLSKHFKEFKAVHNLSFTVPKGSIYGFLGQNGAGKSTTIRMLMGLIQPTTGSIQLFEKNVNTSSKAILQNVGAVIERPDLYKYLTAYENVKLFATLSNVKVTAKQINDVLDKVGLGNWTKEKMKNFSQGMKQRLGIATALIHNPALIILDEPVNGLDPQGIADMRNLILHLKNDLGKTVVISSHLLSEMQMIATDLLIIHKGQKVVEGKMDDLLNPNIVQLEITTNTAAAKVVQQLQQSQWATAIKNSYDNVVIIRVQKEDVAMLNQYLVQHNIAVTSFRPQHSLEDYFLEQINLYGAMQNKQTTS
jgi:ABC-type multidrug transport system ATPase subunit